MTDNAPKPEVMIQSRVIFESELSPAQQRRLQRRRNCLSLAMALPGGVQLLNGEPLRAIVWFFFVGLAYLWFIPVGLVLHILSWSFFTSRPGSWLDRLNNAPWDEP